MNPFYLPPEPKRQDNTFAEILAGLKLGLDAYGTYQTGAIANRREDLTELERVMQGQRDYDMEQYRTKELDLKGKEIGVRERGVAATEQANALKGNENPHLLPFDSVRIAAGKRFLTNQAGLKDDNEIVQYFNELSTSEMKPTREEAFLALSEKYKANRIQMAQTIADNIAAKVESKPGYENTEEGKRQIALVNMIDNDPTGEKVLGSIFGPTIASMKRRDAAAEKPIFVSQGGSLVNPRTGAVWTAPSKPERPVSVPQGGALIDPQTGQPLYTNPARPERPLSVPQGGTLVDPATGRTLFQAPGKPESDRPVSVPEGGTLVNPKTGTPIYTAPRTVKEGKLSDIEKQELIGIRSDLRTVNRELMETRRNAGFGLEAAKNRLPLIEAEYNDLKAREKELLTKDTGGATEPAVKPGVNAKALIDEANQAIARGADPVKVKKRLKDKYGIMVK